MKWRLFSFAAFLALICFFAAGSVFEHVRNFYVAHSPRSQVFFGRMAAPLSGGLVGIAIGLTLGYKAKRRRSELSLNGGD